MDKEATLRLEAEVEKLNKQLRNGAIDAEGASQQYFLLKDKYTPTEQQWH